jgi:hypothetical protein
MLAARGSLSPALILQSGQICTGYHHYSSVPLVEHAAETTRPGIRTSPPFFSAGLQRP